MPPAPIIATRRPTGFVAYHLEIAQHAGVIDARNRQLARCDAGRDDDFIRLFQFVGADAMIQAQLNTCGCQLMAEIAQRFAELRLAGDLAGDIKLAANLRIGFIQGDVMAALRRLQRERHTGRTGTYHRRVLAARRR